MATRFGRYTHDRSPTTQTRGSTWEWLGIASVVSKSPTRWRCPSLNQISKLVKIGAGSEHGEPGLPALRYEVQPEQGADECRWVAQVAMAA